MLACIKKYIRQHYKKIMNECIYSIDGIYALVSAIHAFRRSNFEMFRASTAQHVWQHHRGTMSIIGCVADSVTLVPF